MTSKGAVKSKAKARADAAWDAWQAMDRDERANCAAYAAGYDPEAFSRVVEAWLSSDLRARDIAGRIASTGSQHAS